MENQKKDISSEEVAQGCSIIIIFVLLLFLVFKCGCSDNEVTSQEQASTDSITIQSTAEVLGEKAVKINLKSPTSAEFDNEKVFYGDTIPGDTINLIGTVDADNIFGTKLRNRFCVKMIFDKNYKDIDNWKIVYVNIIASK